MANDFSNSQNPKPTSEDDKPRKQQNQTTIPDKNIKPKHASVPRSTNPSLGSRSGAKIMIFGFGFLIRCQDIMNLWVWVVALVPRFDESVGEVQGEKEAHGERRKK